MRVNFSFYIFVVGVCVCEHELSMLLFFLFWGCENLSRVKKKKIGLLEKWANRHWLLLQLTIQFLELYYLHWIVLYKSLLRLWRLKIFFC